MRDEQAAQAKLAGVQASNERRRDLLSTLSSINAIRGARGLSPTSPTGIAIRQGVTEEVERSIGVEQLNALNTARGFQYAAAITRQQGRTAKISGILRGIGDFATLGQQLASPKPS